MKSWLLLVLLLVPLALTAQSVKEERTAVLRFGIESEVLELVRQLRQEKNTEYRDALIAAFDNARNDSLKEALLLFFLDLKDKGLESQAMKAIADPDKKGNSLLLNAVEYLTVLKIDSVKDTLVTLMTNKNKVLAATSIRALGKLGAADKAEDLIKLFKDGETDPNLKPDLIWALGEMKAPEAVDLLLEDYDDNESQPLLRRTILEALGKIGDDKAWERVEDALQDPNSDVRSAAVATVASYPGKGDQAALLGAALRDIQVGVRQAGAQAAKKARLPELKELLLYRVRKDPDTKVQVACLQALAAYDDGPATVLMFLADRKSPPAAWRESLNIALDKQYAGTLDAMKKVMEDDMKDKTGGLTAVVVSATLAQRETYRTLYGLALASDKAPARAAALRAISVGKFTEYESVLRGLASKDPDPGVKAQAAAILKEWDTPEPAKKP